MRQITEEQVEAFRARRRATDHAPGRWPITAGIWPVLPSGWGSGKRPPGRRGLEVSPAGAGLYARDY